MWLAGANVTLADSYGADEIAQARDDISARDAALEDVHALLEQEVLRTRDALLVLQAAKEALALAERHGVSEELKRPAASARAAAEKAEGLKQKAEEAAAACRALTARARPLRFEHIFYTRSAYSNSSLYADARRVRGGRPGVRMPQLYFAALDGKEEGVQEAFERGPYMVFCRENRPEITKKSPAR